jgi:hypothetical protein
MYQPVPDAGTGGGVGSGDVDDDDNDELDLSSLQKQVQPPPPPLQRSSSFERSMSRDPVPPMLSSRFASVVLLEVYYVLPVYLRPWTMSQQVGRAAFAANAPPVGLSVGTAPLSFRARRGLFQVFPPRLSRTE